MSPPAAAPPRHVFRGLLRLLRTPPLPEELRRKQLTAGAPPAESARALLRGLYRAAPSGAPDASSPSSPPATAADARRRLAARYLALRTSLAERQRLYELDRGAEERLSPRELSRRAAARAGLHLPDADADGAATGGGSGADAVGDGRGRE